MDMEGGSPYDEILLLLDRVGTDPEVVSDRARFLAVQAEVSTEPDFEVLALAQRCYGLCLRGVGSTKDALLWLRKSVESAVSNGFDSIAASSRLVLASTLAMAGDFESALRATEAALLGLPTNEIVGAFSKRAIFLQRLERKSEAVLAYAETIERAVSDNQELELAKALNNRGLFRVDLGDMSGAIADLLESSERFLDLGLVDTSASIDHNLGWCLARQGLVVEALNAYDRSDAKGGLGNSATWIGAFDRAEVYVAARLLPEALHAAKHADRLAGQAGFECEVPGMSLQLGRIQAALGDTGSAQKSFVLAEARFREQSQPLSAEVAHICRLILGEHKSTNGPLPNPALSSRDDDPHGYRDTMIDVAYCELVRLRLSDRSESHAKMLWLGGLLETGLRSTNSLTRLQACAARIVMIDSEEISTVEKEYELVAAAEKLFLELAHHLEGIHSQELRTVVVDKLELEALFCRAALVTDDPAIFERWIGRLRAAVSAPPQTHQSGAGQGSPLESTDLKQLRELGKGTQRNALEFAVRSTQWTTRASSLVDQNRSEFFHPVVAPGKGEVMLVFAQDSTNVVVSIVTEHSASIETVGTMKDIRTRSEGVCLGAAALFGSNASDSIRAEQRAVSVIRAIDRLEALVLPPSLPDGNLLISTTGCLGSVPWGLFSRLAGRSIMLSSSVPSTDMATQDPTTDTLTTDTKKRVEKLGRRGIRVGIVGGPGLEHGSREVDALAELYGDPLVLQGSEATVDAVCELLNSADVVHVAAHGHRRVDNALFSGIELYDGPLMAYDIERLSRTPETVILSCCDLGAANSGAFGLLGFSGAMVSRGTRQVAGAVLPVSDEMSRLIMVRLHTSMLQGMSVSEALAHSVTTAGSLLERVTAGAYVVKGP
jgi:tetratricopeptide (TPR) repeat protein